MKQLIQTSANQLSFAAGGPLMELILTTIEPEYQFAKTKLVHFNKVESFRCVVDRASLKSLLLALMEYDKAMETEAK